MCLGPAGYLSLASCECSYFRVIVRTKKLLDRKSSACCPGPISKSSSITFQDPPPHSLWVSSSLTPSLSPGPLPHKVSLMRGGARSLGSGRGTRLISPQALPWDSYSPPPITQSPWLSKLCSGPEPFPLCVQPIAEQFLLGLPASLKSNRPQTELIIFPANLFLFLSMPGLGEIAPSREFYDVLSSPPSCLRSKWLSPFSPSPLPQFEFHQFSPESVRLFLNGSTSFCSPKLLQHKLDNTAALLKSIQGRLNTYG